MNKPSEKDIRGPAMTHPMTRHSLPFTALAACVLAVSSGCIIHDNDTYVPPPEPTGPGDISFAWSFEGERSCSTAGVAEVDVLVVRGEQIIFADTVECFGDGLTLRDFDPGSYDLLVDAFGRSGRLLFQGDAAIRVVGDRDNDIGLLQLYSPAPRDGELALFWSFLYPTDSSEVYACEIAGVHSVFVDVEPTGGQAREGFSTTLPCTDEGVVIDQLPAGDYRVTLEADGSYHGENIVLYDAVMDVSIEAGVQNDVGDVALERIYESFADIEVAWDVAGGTCGQLGVDDVTLVITRLDGDIEDDAITLDCSIDYALRETFVPGSYLIEVFGLGVDGDYYGSATRDVAPNTTSEVLVDLVLAP
jgi:hypothetical protein